MKEHCNMWKCSNRVGLFLVALYVICFAWFFVHPVEPDLHLRLLRLSYFGFDGMNIVSFIAGAIQTYIWAYIGVGIWHVTGCCLKSGSCEKK